MREEIIGSARLLLADCRDVLPGLAISDAVVTDPPYGIGFAAQPTKWQRRAGMVAKTWDDDLVDLSTVLDAGKVQVVWGGNYYALPPSRGWLTWFKPDAPPSMASVEMAWTNQNRNTRQISCSIAATNAERVGHPTQKPVAVMNWTLTQFPFARTVTDPFMGSGTTGVSCVLSGRSFTGIEIDPTYYEMALRRIEAAQRQADLFVQQPALASAAPQPAYDLFTPANGADKRTPSRRNGGG